ncbi:hypothetical protein [Catenovulum maritimum]|uniref:Uncharacterized protein n=1 Tax=Catenovulum maritimum TaxID=1513271 RepID=A0A0J8GX71_9ALTE|nr:hypothetical protein [Catenovulum maritimum]KMT65854.1 hypothetical protein XM47_06560 [Catenovulum maritimum]
MKNLIALSLITLAFLNTANAQQKILPPSQQFTESSEFQNIKQRYSQCALTKALEFSQVTDLDTAFKYAPTACRRDLLQIKKMLIGGPYKMDVIDQLVESVQEGVEIDMVNYVLREKLKQLNK